MPLFLFSQSTADTTILADSTLPKNPEVIQPTAAELYNLSMEAVFSKNVLLNSKGLPTAAVIKEKRVQASDFLFYSLLVIALLLAFLRFFYARYFNSLFQVFFNTSLRQSQLTDQLLQAKLIAAFFNLFFVVTGGLYIFSLISYAKTGSGINSPLLIVSCIVVLAFVYLVKYCVLKFTGWLTGFKEVANTYLFIIFLINKILSVLLLPFVVAITFSVSDIRVAAVIVSLLMVGFMFFLRYIRSYGLLRNKIKVGWFHFLVFVAGVEILPLLLIYKGVVFLLPKSL